jgi:hypothetical protein
MGAILALGLDRAVRGSLFGGNVIEPDSDEMLITLQC